MIRTSISVDLSTVQGPSCIRLNQSALRSRKQQAIEVRREHDSMCTKVQHHLVDNYRVPPTNAIFRDYSQQLLDYLQQSYFAPLPYQHRILAEQQARTVTSIRAKIKQHNLVIRVTDKGHNFYIGSTNEFEKKAEQFFADTNAFLELTENPFNELLAKVIHLLDDLRSKKRILKWQYDEMMPGRKTTELAHLYFNPKTHKVRSTSPR